MALIHHADMTKINQLGMESRNQQIKSVIRDWKAHSMKKSTMYGKKKKLKKKIMANEREREREYYSCGAFSKF